MHYTIFKELGNGLILRNATFEDADELAIFNSNIHKDPGQEEPNEFIDAWVRNLMTKPHPTLKPTDFTVVLDKTTGKIVSSMNLIPQTWSYEGIEFEVGRPELVGTDPEYRRRGLIREQFNVVHQWSEERGHKMQAITGIPFYYRQFGYEMCMDLGGSRVGYRPHVPKLKDDEKEKFAFRPVTVEDIPFISTVYNYIIKRSLIACVRDDATWKYDIFGKPEKATATWMIITTREGEALGFCLHAKEMWGPNIQLWGYELKPGVSYLEVTPSLIRYLEKTGLELAEKKEDIELQGYSFGLGGKHPAYDVLPERMPRMGKPYAWYIRVPDLSDFLNHIAPVLEIRLAESPAVGFTGDLKLNFYRSGVRISFEKGCVKGVESYNPLSAEDGDVLFPDLTFLQLLVGHTSFAELSDSRPDCSARSDHGRALMRYLFPQKASNVWAIN
jgi:GNAT superfamily N-acetyltransferase